MPEPHVFHTGCNELVRKVGINFDDKYLVLASPGGRKRQQYQNRSFALKREIKSLDNRCKAVAEIVFSALVKSGEILLSFLFTCDQGRKIVFFSEIKNRSLFLKRCFDL